MAKSSRDAKFRDAQKSIVIIGDHNKVEKPQTIIAPSKAFIFIGVLVVVAAAGVLVYSFMLSPTTTAPVNGNLAYGNSLLHTPDETYPIEITSRMITKIKLEKDDQAMISAEGQIRLGPFAGVAGPEGVPGFTSYNILNDDRHGALFARIRDDDDDEKWKRIGKEGTLTAKHTGVLELLVNDNDPSNNQGSFNVTVQVYRKK